MTAAKQGSPNLAPPKTADGKEPARRARRRREPVKQMTSGANLFFDSMIVNLAASRADADVETLLESSHVQCLLPYSVLAEATRPGVPAPIRSATARFLYTIMAPLTVPERADAAAFLATNQRQSLARNITADLTHVWEAAKYGGRFFITLDRRLTKRADAIYRHKGLWLMTPAEAAALHAAMLEVSEANADLY